MRQKKYKEPGFLTKSLFRIPSYLICIIYAYSYFQIVGICTFLNNTEKLIIQIIAGLLLLHSFCSNIYGFIIDLRIFFTKMNRFQEYFF